MIQATERKNQRLQARLERLAARDRDYWAFRGNARREHGHGLFQYPAMMVPQLARVILDEVSTVHPEVECIGDPFAGSGTILTESMLKGLNFSGCDVNPLAVLLCRTKAGPFFCRALADDADRLVARATSDRSVRLEANFPGMRKWFRADVCVAISRIRRAVRRIDSLPSRRFAWVALAETVRLTSNSRTSTFKLHTRTTDEIQNRNIDPISVFEKVLRRNLDHVISEADALRSRQRLVGGRYTGTINVALRDAARASNLVAPLADVLITSPPYGDNVTTVPYGQYSYLLLQWIDSADIDPGIDDAYLRSTHEIDARSLGGSRRICQADSATLAEKSPALRRLLSRIPSDRPDAESRVTAFFRDLDRCLGPILATVRRGGILVWILGNRRVANVSVPLDKVVADLLRCRGATPLASLRRRIPSKRMAVKNNIAHTMSAETILIMRKAS